LLKLTKNNNVLKINNENAVTNSLINGLYSITFQYLLKAPAFIGLINKHLPG